MKKNMENKMNPISRMSRLFVALTFVIGSAGGASAQTMGSTLASFNILANTAVTLTGAGANQLIVDSVGISPGIALATTEASVTHYHANDDVSRTGKTEGLAYWNSLVNAVSPNPIEQLAAGTLPPTLPDTSIPSPNGVAFASGITLIKGPLGGNITTSNQTTTITGVAGSILIFQVDTFVTFTNMHLALVGVLPENIHWQVKTGVTIVNNNAVLVPRSMPGTFINNTGASDIAITVGSGILNVGRFVSQQGSVSFTKSGGTLNFNVPVNGPAIFSPGCSDGLFYPSPATGATGSFSYCMESAGTVNIRVYNVIGDLAAKIEDTKVAGQYTSTLDTSRLAPGVYLYILERNYNGGNKTRSKVKKFVVQH